MLVESPKQRGIFCFAATGDPQIGGGWNNQQLMKGCGLIPWLFHKKYNFRAVMVGLKADTEYPYIDSYLKGLELDFLPEDTPQARIDYLDSHIADIDVLMLYGAYPKHISIAEHYKKIKPDGKIYLATDMNMGWVKRINAVYARYQSFFKICDVIGACNSVTQKYMANNWGIPVALIRNGWYNFTGVTFDNTVKEDVILTVGRIGSRQKQNNVLLEAFAEVARDIPDWKLKLVGSIEEKFKPYIEEYFKKYPTLRDRVTFAGLISDKAALMEEYKRAKVFCLTSNVEGAPNAATEALWAGDFVITSSIDAADDITDSGLCGRVFPIGKTYTLARLLKKCCRNKKLLVAGKEHAATYARANYDENQIADYLYSLLFGEDNGK